MKPVLNDTERDVLARFMTSGGHPAARTLRRLVIGVTELNMPGPYSERALDDLTTDGAHSLEEYRLALTLDEFCKSPTSASESDNPYLL